MKLFYINIIIVTKEHGKSLRFIYIPPNSVQILISLQTCILYSCQSLHVPSPLPSSKLMEKHTLCPLY